jgi:GR25 family glycosyltransferase involved in LPS biosynthesis
MRLLHPFLYLLLLIVCIAELPLPLLAAVTKLSDSPHIHRQETPIRKALVPIPQIEPKCGIEGVDCLYVINLEKRPEKWERTQSLCQEYGLHPSRVNAVDGTTLSKKTLKAICGPYPIRMKLGQTGCFLSHVSIFLDSYQRKFNCVWICEDDIEFLDDPGQIPAFLKELTGIDPDWDILYTDPNSTVPACYDWPVAPGTPIPNYASDFRPDQSHFPKRYYFAKQAVGEHFTRIGQRFGLYSYIVSKKGLQKLVNYFLHVYLYTVIDMDIHYVPYIRQYVLNKPVVSHWIDSGTHDTDANDRNP